MNIEDNIINILTKHDNIVFAYLFGSFVNAPDKVNSDIDIGIYFKDSIDLLYLGKIIGEINASTSKKIDIVEMNSLFVKNPLLAYEIITKGKVITCLNKEELINFKTRTFLSYFDTINLRDAVNMKFYQRLSDRNFGKRNYA